MKKSNQFFCIHKISPSHTECTFGIIGIQDCENCDNNKECSHCIKKNNKNLCEICNNDKKADSSEG